MLKIEEYIVFIIENKLFQISENLVWWNEYELLRTTKILEGSIVLQDPLNELDKESALLIRNNLRQIEFDFIPEVFDWMDFVLGEDTNYWQDGTGGEE